MIIVWTVWSILIVIRRCILHGTHVCVDNQMKHHSHLWMDRSDCIPHRYRSTWMKINFDDIQIQIDVRIRFLTSRCTPTSRINSTRPFILEGKMSILDYMLSSSQLPIDARTHVSWQSFVLFLFPKRKTTHQTIWSLTCNWNNINVHFVVWPLLVFQSNRPWSWATRLIHLFI